MTVNRNRRLVLATVAATAAASTTLLGACSKSGTPSAGDPLKVAFVYVGPVGDGGWSYAHDMGRRGIEAHFGAKIKTTVVESVPEGADAERVFRDLAAQGHKLIFGTSFGYMEAMLKVAREFPDVKFEHATGYKTGPNLATYDAKTFGGAYLAGLVAGKMTKSNQLGVVASHPIPEVVRNINAFTLGARQVNPDATTRVVWVSSWFDPAKERDAAMTLIGQGVDVLIQNTDSPATLQAAAEKGVYAFGWDSDMQKYGPKAHLASAVINWTPYYTQSVQSVLDNTWKPMQTWWGAVEGVIDLVNLNEAIPEDVRKLVAEKKAIMAAGTSVIFTGPLYDQQGKEIVVTGQVMNDVMLKGMDFYVRGVQGTVPK